MPYLCFGKSGRRTIRLCSLERALARCHPVRIDRLSAIPTPLFGLRHTRPAGRPPVARRRDHVALGEVARRCTPPHDRYRTTQSSCWCRRTCLAVVTPASESDRAERPHASRLRPQPLRHAAKGRATRRMPDGTAVTDAVRAGTERGVGAGAARSRERRRAGPRSIA